MSLNMLSESIPVLIAVVAATVSIITKAATDLYTTWRATKRVLQAEKEAFKTAPERDLVKAEEIDPSATGKFRIRDHRDALQIGNLFDLYNKQMERYQTETIARAGWSFIFAIIAMVAGLGFVVAGGAYGLAASGWEHVGAATAISGIGGGVSAFITKTFLDVHRLSLTQLNHYFRQPVLNSHVLTAQRIADQMMDRPTRDRCYQEILTAVVALISEPSDDEGSRRSKTPTKASVGSKKPKPTKPPEDASPKKLEVA